MTTIILFLSSTILIIVLFLLKHFELRRGIRFLETKRGKLDTRVEKGAYYAAHVLPKKVAFHSVDIATNATQKVTLVLLAGLRGMERKLLGVNNTIKGKKEIHRRKASNAYLEDVSNHKKEIVRNRENGSLKNE